MEVWCKDRAFSTALYGLGWAMKMSSATKKEDRAMYKDRASGTDRRSVPSTVRPLHTPKSSGSAQIKMCNVRAVHSDSILSYSDRWSVRGKGNIPKGSEWAVCASWKGKGALPLHQDQSPPFIQMKQSELSIQSKVASYHQNIKDHSSLILAIQSILYSCP